jgi:hypothetical protein
LLLILLSGLILWRLWQTPSTASSSVSVEQSNEFKTPLLSFYNPFFLIAATMITVSVTYFLLARYFITDQQFGPPDDGYTQALNTVVTKASSGDLIITVAQNHYHVPMNRFKARLPIVGFAQQAWPPPESALTLLEASSDQNNWLITVGYQPAAQDNAIERWLALNAFKASDEWFPNEMRLSRYGTEPPTITRPINVTFAQEVRLLEVKLAELLHPGQLLPVELAWLPLDQPRLDYNLFLQLLTAEGTLVVQHDGPPNGGYTPTSAWQAGQQVRDRHALVLPVDLQPDNYRLIVGLYDPDTAERLTVADDGDFVELGTITVESYP